MDVEITQAQPHDAIEIARVHNLAWLATYVNKEITKEDILSLQLEGLQRINTLRDYLAQQNDFNHTFVAKSDGVVIGFCTVMKEEGSNKIHSLYILPKYHRQGVGKKLLQEAINWFDDDGDITLSVAMYNYKAQEFYLTQGFEFTGGCSSFSLHPRDKTIHGLVMSLSSAR